MQSSDFPVEFIIFGDLGELRTQQDLELTGWDEHGEYLEWLQLVTGKNTMEEMKIHVFHSK